MTSTERQHDDLMKRLMFFDGKETAILNTKRFKDFICKEKKAKVLLTDHFLVRHDMLRISTLLVTALCQPL